MGLKNKFIRFLKKTKNLLLDETEDFDSPEEEGKEVYLTEDEIDNEWEEDEREKENESLNSDKFINFSESEPEAQQDSNFDFPPEEKNEEFEFFQASTEQVTYQEPPNTTSEIHLEKWEEIPPIFLKKQENKRKVSVTKFKKHRLGDCITLKRDIKKSKDSSLPFIIPTVAKEMNFPSNLMKANLLIEDGDFVANLKNLDSPEIALYESKDKISALTRENDYYYVFKTKEELLNKHFLEFLIQNEEFDKKLKNLTSNHGKPWKTFSEQISINVPPLEWQENVMQEKRAIKGLIEVKEKISKSLEDLMDNYFHSLFEDESFTSKNFQELFSLDGENKLVTFDLELNEKKEKSKKFMFSSLKDLVINECEFSELSRLFLSQNVLGEVEHKYSLNFWLGSSDFSSINNLISIIPNQSLGIPYGYYLLKSNLDNLINNLPSIVTKRFVSLTELKNYDFEVHSQEKIDMFNEICQPILEYQQLIEEEIYKLTKLQEKGSQIAFLRTFNKKLSS